MRTAGVLVASFGGAALLAGLALNLKVNGMASDMEKYDGYTKAKEADRSSYRQWGWIGYGVGAACVATGAILYAVGLRSQSTSMGLVTPVFMVGGAGASLQGAF
jgi:hypothetical protein